MTEDISMGNGKNKYRFYLWDYLWWLGEKWKQRRSERVDGSFLLYCYIMALIIMPLMFLSSWPFTDWFPTDTAMIQLIVWLAVALVGYSWIEWIYRRRGKAMLKHYAKHSFHEAVAVLLFILSTAIMIFQMYCYEYYIPKP